GVPRVRLRNFRWKSGTRIIESSALWFSKFVPECAALYHELRKPGTSAADLKFLHRVPRVRLRNFKSKSGTRIIELLVPFGFRSSCPSVPRCITNFENRALVACSLPGRNAEMSNVAMMVPQGAETVFP